MSQLQHITWPIQISELQMGIFSFFSNRPLSNHLLDEWVLVDSDILATEDNIVNSFAEHDNTLENPVIQISNSPTLKKKHSDIKKSERLERQKQRQANAIHPILAQMKAMEVKTRRLNRI